MEYTIIRSSRKTIAIQIKPNGQIVVRCPRRMHTAEVQAFVRSKQSWVEKHLAKIHPEDVYPFSPEEMERLKKQTQETVKERADFYAPIIGVNYNTISIRAQHTRWGSCSSKGNLNFNCLLGLVPPEALDYVVVHELCHRKHMNHSHEFWAEVEQILPDYRKRKQWLKENGGKLIARLPKRK